MKENLIHISFDNQTNPNSTFDIIKLEQLFERSFIDHSPQKLHKVDFFILFLITEGQGYHTIDFTDYKYETGTVITIRKDQIHKFFKGNNSKGHLLLFKDEFLVSYLEKLEAQKSLQLFNELLGVPKIQLSSKDFNEIHQIVLRIENEYLNQFDEYSLGVIRSELHILISKLFRIKSKENPILLEKKYVSEFILFQQLVEDKANTTTRVNDYASLMSISAKKLNMISQNIINKTAKEFIDDINIKQIKRLLINTSFPVKQIAYSSGFEETTNFYKYFKRQVGTTPEQFRSSF